MGMERARTAEAYAGVMMDRALFITPEYMADVFGAFARVPRKMDLAWHIRGEFASDLAMEPTALPKPVENGYSELANLRHATTDKPWSATIARGGKAARFLAAGGTPTEVLVAEGLLELEKPPTILERRTGGSTVYGNVVDVSGLAHGYAADPVLEGGLDQGYAMLKIRAPAGVDRCFVSYRPGKYKSDDFETDAQQAMVLTGCFLPWRMYLGGGTFLKCGGLSLERSEPGLAYVERAEGGAVIVGNPSPTEATVTVRAVPPLPDWAYELDAAGRRLGEARFERAGGAVTLKMKPASKIEFAAKDATSVFDRRQAMLRQRQADEEAARTKARDECLARTAAREKEAKDNPVPAGTIVAVQAEDFSAQGGGKIGVTAEKRAAIGKCINMWDAMGQWVEWTVEAPAEGCYHLTLCYCSEMDKAARELKVNGEVQEPFAPMVFPSTGGWANGSDDWRLYTAENPATDRPLLIKLKRGPNTVRLTNTNGRGINVDYLAVTSPDVKVDRDMLAARLKK